MLIENFESILRTLVQIAHVETDFHPPQDTSEPEEVRIARRLNAAFLLHLAGEDHPLHEPAGRYLSSLQGSPDWDEAAAFYLKGVELVRQEIRTAGVSQTDFPHRLSSLADWLAREPHPDLTLESAEKFWSVFFPEGTGILGREEARIQTLQDKRAVDLSALNSNPINDPARQVLFSANVLLTLPPKSRSLDELPLEEEMRAELERVTQEPQRYWYDHPIQIGVPPERNEVIYGMRGLAQALEFEKARGSTPEDARLTCVLSVSVTHSGLHSIAWDYLQGECSRGSILRDMDIYAFTEADTKNLVNEVLTPAARHYLGREDAEKALDMFGVDGEYARHYTFLKAVAAFWSVFIDPQIKATFKIDLDQVFPQQELVDASGMSAFEHLMTPLWGAYGIDRDGKPLDLGMLAGALVNEADIDQGLFTPDVPFPTHLTEPQELIFFSRLPQALSTRAEMMTRYTGDELDGQSRCIQRYHVTGGTNGILVESLLRHRPFTPSFIGRAEDQAYLLSVFETSGRRLAYAHQPGLIMRHDKHAFAQDAIQAARTGVQVGDYVRLLLFSAYARFLSDDITAIKEQLDPFTGCFISQIPVTVTYLRFALQAAALFAQDQAQKGVDFINIGSRRIRQTLEFTGEDEGASLGRALREERRGWELYYDTLTAVRDALLRRDGFALQLQERARHLVGRLVIRS